MSNARLISLTVRLADRALESETTCVWSGPYALTIATTLPEQGIAVEVHSVFVGHHGVSTQVTHLTLGPVDQSPAIVHTEHDGTALDPVLNPRDCAYEHAQFMLGVLGARLKLNVAIDVPDDAFDDLERVEPR